MSGKISVIIPVFNTAYQLLERATESALCQDSVLEVIIVDDGSEVGTAYAVDEMMGKSKKIKVIHKDNGGASSARNTGLDLARGEYVAFLDADDELTNSFCSEALGILQKYDVDAVFGAMDYVFDSGKIKYVGNAELSGTAIKLSGHQIDSVIGSLFNRDALRRLGLKPAMYVSQCAVLYKRTTIGSHRFREGIKISEDRLFNFDVLLECNDICITGNVWYRYIQNGSSASQSLRRDSCNDLLKTAKEFDILKQQYPAVSEDINIGIIECLQQTLYFSILHSDFRYTGLSEKEYVKRLLDQSVYQRAFQHAGTMRFKQRILRFLFLHRMPMTIVVLFHVNKLLFDVKTKLL